MVEAGGRELIGMSWFGTARCGLSDAKVCAANLSTRATVALWSSWYCGWPFKALADSPVVGCLADRVDRAGKPGAASCNIPMTGT